MGPTAVSPCPEFASSPPCRSTRACSMGLRSAPGAGLCAPLRPGTLGAGKAALHARLNALAAVLSLAGLYALTLLLSGVSSDDAAASQQPVRARDQGRNAARQNGSRGTGTTPWLHRRLQWRVCRAPAMQWRCAAARRRSAAVARRRTRAHGMPQCGAGLGAPAGAVRPRCARPLGARARQGPAWFRLAQLARDQIAPRQSSDTRLMQTAAKRVHLTRCRRNCTPAVARRGPAGGDGHARPGAPGRPGAGRAGGVRRAPRWPSRASAPPPQSVALQRRRRAGAGAATGAAAGWSDEAGGRRVHRQRHDCVRRQPVLQRRHRDLPNKSRQPQLCGQA